MKKSLVIAVLLCFYGSIPLFCGSFFSKSPAGEVGADKKMVLVAPASGGRKVALTGDSQEIDMNFEGDVEAPFCWDLKAHESGYDDLPASAHAQFIFKFYFHLEGVLQRKKDRAERLARIIADLERYKKVAELPRVVEAILKDIIWYQQAHIEGLLDDSLAQYLRMIRTAREKGDYFYRMSCAEKLAAGYDS